jgi:hypothetical protein
MAVYTQEIATEFNFPNITIYRKLKDGVHYAWSVRANDGYVIYDTAANNTEVNPETGEEIPVIYYYTELSCPLREDFVDFTWVAVPRNSVDENYIFGGGNERE